MCMQHNNTLVLSASPPVVIIAMHACSVPNSRALVSDPVHVTCRSCVRSSRCSLC